MTDRTDNFNRAGPGLGANWTTSENLTALVISASTVVKGQTVNADHAGYWSADTFADDQNSIVTLSGSFADGGGPLVRHQTGASTFYMIYNGSNNTGFTYFEITAGSFAALGSIITAGAGVVSTLKLAVSGSTLTATVDSTNLATRTDSSITSGKPGIHIFTTALSWDNWQGGPISVSGAMPPFSRRKRFFTRSF